MCTRVRGFEGGGGTNSSQGGLVCTPGCLLAPTGQRTQQHQWLGWPFWRWGGGGVVTESSLFHIAGFPREGRRLRRNPTVLNADFGGTAAQGGQLAQRFGHYLRRMSGPARLARTVECSCRPTAAPPLPTHTQPGIQCILRGELLACDGLGGFPREGRALRSNPAVLFFSAGFGGTASLGRFVALEATWAFVRKKGTN